MFSRGDRQYQQYCSLVSRSIVDTVCLEVPIEDQQQSWGLDEQVFQNNRCPAAAPTNAAKKKWLTSVIQLSCQSVIQSALRRMADRITH